MTNDNLGDRMKKYENISRLYLTPRTPVIIRLDGKAFHTFTRGFKRPFDDVLSKSMQDTMQYLCENIQGCVLGYTQSDEITLVLVDYKDIDSMGWFDYNIQKMCSVSASMATMAFNNAFRHNVQEYRQSGKVDAEQVEVYLKAVLKGAMFDSRCFNLPKEEVTNCVLWRQNDASRNSVEMVGFANFSKTQMHGKSCSQVQDMLMLEKGINWNDLPIKYKRGSCCIRKEFKGLEHPKWVIDDEIPIFKGEGRNYIEQLIHFDD